MPNLERGTAQCSFDTGSEYGNITPSIDTGNFNMLVSDCVIANKGNMFTLGQSQGSLVISFASNNQAKIGGAFWILNSSASITLEANQEQYVCLTIDKSQQDGSKADITLKTLAQIQKGDLYGGDSVRDLPIYKITTNATGISNVVDMRKIVKDTLLISQSEYDDLTKDTHTFYLVVED